MDNFINDHDALALSKAVGTIIDNPEATKADVMESIRKQYGDAWFEANRKYLEAEYDFLKTQFKL